MNGHTGTMNFDLKPL